MPDDPPLCPNCSRPMALSHVFYAEPGGPKMRHFSCKYCSVGITKADDEDNDEKVR